MEVRSWYQRMIGEQGYDLVWGGSDVGTMHVISHEARAAGAKLIGVTTGSLSRSQHQSADEMIVAEDLGKRKMVLVERSDALVVLPGGTGTLDEVADVIERKKFGHHYKPILFLNADGFYEGLKIQFDRMESEGMLNRSLSDIVSFVTTPTEALELIERMQADHLRPILDAHSMVEQAQISGGHSGALLYRTRNKDGQRSVIKVSKDRLSTEEVKSNIRAYRAIANAGIKQLIPDVEFGEDPAGRKYVVMPDLGQTFTFQARSETGADYETLIEAVNETFIASVRQGREEHVESIFLTKTVLKKFLESLHTGGIAGQDTLNKVNKLSSDEMSSNKSSFFFLDFTPDNVFVHDGKVEFIDPWEQTTYRGSTIPTLAQFQTLSKAVYKLPGAKKADPLFEEAFKHIGKELDLSNSQIEQQRLLGSALQFSLSSFTRMHSDPENARKYYRKCLQSIENIIELSKK